MKDLMFDIGTQGKKWINQFQEAVVDEPLLDNINVEDVGKIAQLVYDQAS